MTGEFIAVAGCTIDHDTGSTISGGTFSITSTTIAECKAEGQEFYTIEIAFTFSGGSDSTVGVVAGSVVGAGTIAATAQKVKAKNGFVMREGDTGTLTGTGTNPAAPPPTLAVSGPVIITAAGQSKVRAL